ncbi:hypothetical protein B7463_g6561, partial [Scytalidium lignicola]
MRLLSSTVLPSLFLLIFNNAMHASALAIAALAPPSVVTSGNGEGISLNYVDVENHPGVSISYRKAFCETTPDVSAFSGFVNIPSSHFSFLATNKSTVFNISTFFWLFPARHNPDSAPLSIYLAGGPGSASSYVATMESGPCVAQPDNNSTVINPWSFNNYVNILYIDQPLYTGFSYDDIQDGLLNIITNDVYPQSGPGNATLWSGKFGSQDPSRTVQHFPTHHGWKQRKLSLWGNSYGGYYTTVSFAYFQSQNEKLAAGQLDHRKYCHLNLDTVGITNGCMDLAIQGASYPEIAYNNTYNVSFLPQSIYEQTKLNFTRPGGCLDQITQCRNLANKLDPNNFGNDEQVNDLCASVVQYCALYVEDTYVGVSGRSTFDMAHLLANPWPPNYPAGFFNQYWVQQDLGVPVNFTLDSNLVTNTFFSTGDPVRQNISALEYLLESDIKVALVYGDRDYVLKHSPLPPKYPFAEQFHSAGYTPISTNASYTGGVVRQQGRRLSFSRVFQSGHSASSYQPETVYQIFMRAMFDRDVATGKIDLGGHATDQYASQGPSSSWGWTEKLPGIPPQECSLWNMPGSCDDAQNAAVAAGNATINPFDTVIEPQ